MDHTTGLGLAATRELMTLLPQRREHSDCVVLPKGCPNFIGLHCILWTGALADLKNSLRDLRKGHGFDVGNEDSATLFEVREVA